MASTWYHSDDIAASKHGIDDLGGDVRKLKRRKETRNIELISPHIEVLLHSGDICVIYVRSVKVWQKMT